MKNGRFKDLVVLQVCQLSKSHGSSNQLSRAHLQISIYAQMYVFVVRTLQRSANFEGPSSVIISQEQVSQHCWQIVTIATPVFPVFSFEILLFYLCNIFIPSIKWDENNVFISEETEQALATPTRLLIYNLFLC